MSYTKVNDEFFSIGKKHVLTYKNLWTT